MIKLRHMKDLEKNEGYWINNTWYVPGSSSNEEVFETNAEPLPIPTNSRTQIERQELNDRTQHLSEQERNLNELGTEVLSLVREFAQTINVTVFYSSEEAPLYARKSLYLMVDEIEKNIIAIGLPDIVFNYNQLLSKIQHALDYLQTLTFKNASFAKEPANIERGHYQAVYKLGIKRLNNLSQKLQHFVK
jgi:hypothetical protein